MDTMETILGAYKYALKHRVGLVSRIVITKITGE